MKFRKIVCLLLVLCLALPLLYGCTADEQALLAAYLKTQSATSYSAETSVVISTKTDKLTEPNVKLALDLLNGFTIKAKIDMISDPEKKTLKEYAVFSTQIMGLKIEVPVWIDLDLADANAPKGKIVVKAPESLSGYFDKTYYYFDLADLMDLYDELGIDINSLMSFDTTSLLSAFTKLDLSGIKISKTADGYRINIADDDIYPLVKQFYQVIFEIPQFSTLMTEDQKTEFFGAFDQIQKLDLFGDDGIVANISLNKEGFIDTSSAKVGIYIDSDKLKDTFGISYLDSFGSLGVTYDVTSKYSNYNAVKEITPIPELTEENSLSIIEAFQSSYDDYGDDGDYGNDSDYPDVGDDEDAYDEQYKDNQVGDVIGQVLNTDIVAYIDGKPIKSYNIDGNTAISVEDLMNYGFDVEWNAENKWLDIYDVYGDITSTYKPEATSAPVGSVAYDVLLSDIDTYIDGNIWIKSFNVNGSTMIYIDKLAYFGELEWDADARTISFNRY